MKIEIKPELLRRVKKIDAPPFLLTRIQAKLRAAEAERVPVSWRWAVSLVFFLLLVSNFYFLKMEKTDHAAPAETLVVKLQLQCYNQLYNE